MVKTALPLQGLKVQSLVRQRRSHMLHGMAIKGFKKKKMRDHFRETVYGNP